MGRCQAEEKKLPGKDIENKQILVTQIPPSAGTCRIHFKPSVEKTVSTTHSYIVCLVHRQYVLIPQKSPSVPCRRISPSTATHTHLLASLAPATAQEIQGSLATFAPSEATHPDRAQPCTVRRNPEPTVCLCSLFF